MEPNHGNHEIMSTKLKKANNIFQIPSKKKLQDFPELRPNIINSVFHDEGKQKLKIL